MNYYDILGISNTATNSEIKKAYKTLVKKYHPDVFEGDKSVADSKIKQLNEAYEVLSNADERAKYDESLLAVSNESTTSSNNYSNSQTTDYDVYKKYDDLYKYDYYKKYTTNYYGVSRDNLHNEKSKTFYQNRKVQDSDFFMGSRTKFVFLISILLVIFLVILLILISYLKTLLVVAPKTTINSIEYSDIDNSDVITFGMSYDEVCDILGAPDYIKRKSNDYYAYWGNSYIIFNSKNLAYGWKNNGDFITETDTEQNVNSLFDLYNF